MTDLRAQDGNSISGRRLAGGVSALRPGVPLTCWLLALGVAVLVLRKPWALHTPQLYAEDGSIFLMQNDLLGLRAFTTPYMGYLHLIPRCIAWLAAHTLDPAWWPALYNLSALAITVVLLARFASPRLDLPGKPWLVLALFLGANTGEVLLSITNLQWMTAFVLLQQVLIARPASTAQRAGDIALIAFTGLTGPFVIAWLPLFAWRWWRDRHADNLAGLLTATACAAVQAWYLLTAGPRLDYQSLPFHPVMLITVLARRLAVWPAFGPTAALNLPPVAVALVGGAILAGLGAWALRPHPRRRLRAQVLAALALMVGAGIYRCRPDTWDGDNLWYADRYFYIPRVLVAWLLVWEFDAVPRAVAYAARALCVAGVLTNLPGYQIPAPPNYHWADHCESIRRGVPADIPTLPEGWTLEYRGRPPKPSGSR